MGKNILLLAAIAAILLLSGCAMPQLPGSSQPPAGTTPAKPVAPPQQPSQPAQQEQDALSAQQFANITSQKPAQYTVRYAESALVQNQTLKISESAYYYMQNEGARVDFINYSDRAIDERRGYLIGNDAYSCTKPRGALWGCLKVGSMPAYGTGLMPSLESAAANASSYIVSAEAGEQQFAGANATCFGLAGKNQTSYRLCFSQEGVLLYGMQNASSGAASEIEALNYTPSSLFDDFVLPAAAQDTTTDKFANIMPRNVSDRIGDGQFRVDDQGAYPLRIYAVNDGFADSILISKGSFNVLVDAGNAGPVEALLGSLRIARLDVLVASRDDPGAIGGMGEILDKYGVGEFWDNGVPATSDDYKALLSEVSSRNITVKHPEAADSMNFSGVAFTVLNPQKQRLLGAPESDAVVLKVSMGGFCMLLLNPTVQERENVLLSTGQDLNCPVVTYFSHGEGRPEPSLIISNVAPKDVIISVGANSEGLPSQTTITRLGIAGSNVWRTDERGTIRVLYDGYAPYEIASRMNESSNWLTYGGMNATSD